MAKNYVLEKDAKLALSYGMLSVTSKLVRWETLAVGSDLQVTLQQALGEAPWDSVVKLGYGSDAIQEITSDNYRFFGTPGAASDFFPSDVEHPDAAYIDVRLPIGVSSDNDPDKLIGIYKCLKIADYDETGTQTDFSFSANPARVAMDLIKRLRPRLITYNLIEWAAWCEWRDWCAELIDVTVDGVTTQIPRFEANCFFVPPFNLAQILDRLCQICCSDWQWRNGKLRFMAPLTRTPVFTFDLNEVDEKPSDFKWIPADTKQRPNGVRIYWRDFDHPYLKEQDPFVVKRDDLIEADGGIENFLEINVGVARKSQVERTANYWVKLRCDLADYAQFTGSFRSYSVLPADTILLTHDVPDFTNKQFLVVEKEEDEDNGIGYPYKLQNFPVQPYSDTDHSPIVTSAPAEGVNPFSAPPEPGLTLIQAGQNLNDGTVRVRLLGTIAFGDFGFKQFAKILWKKPGAASYEEYTERRPDGSNTAQFEVYNFGTGTHKFKAISYSELGVPMAGSGTEHEVVITATIFTADGRNVVDGVDRSRTGFDTSGRYRGLDSDVVPISAVTASVIKSVPFDNGENVDVNIAGEVTGAKVLQSSQGDSIFQSKVDVYNKFGELVISFVPDGFTGAGTLGKGTYPRKYADPLEEAYFKIVIRNYWGWNAPKYLQGTTLSDSAPTAKVRANCPLELSGTALSATTIKISYQFTGNVSLYRRKVGQGINDWVLHQAGITASPYEAGDFPEYADYELQLRSDADSNNRSNIIRVKTKPQGEGAPSRPAPTAPNGAPDASDPQHVLNFSCVSSANVETEVWVNGSLATTLSAVAVGGTISYQITGLSPGDSRAVKWRHKWATDDYSVSFTEEITRSTQGATPSGTAPALNWGSWQQYSGRNRVNMTPGSGATGYTVKRSLESADTGFDENYDSILAANTTDYYDYGIVQDPSVGYFIWYKIVQNDTGLVSNVKEVWVPSADEFGNPCFTGETLILMADLSLRRIDEIKKDDWVMGFDLGGNLHPARVMRAPKHSVREHLNIIFEGRRNARKVTREHPYWLPNGLFLPIGNIPVGDPVQMRINEICMPRMIEKKETICCLNEYGAEYIDVHNLHTTMNTFIVVDEETGEQELVHNSKA